MNSVNSRAAPMKIAIGVAICVVVASGFVLLRVYEPADTSWHPKCVFHLWTGLHCPGCGSTRAAYALSKGHVWTAIRCNPLLILGGPVIALLLWWQRRRERSSGMASPRLSWTICAIFIGYFLLRNVPSPQRSWLAPPSASVTESASTGR